MGETKNYTTIRLKVETVKALREKGIKGETYDDIILRLIQK